MTKVYTVIYDSPLGPLTVVSDGNAITGLWMKENRYFPMHIDNAVDGSKLAVIQQAMAWLDSYFAGSNRLPPMPPLAPVDSIFQMKVWEILLTIPYGQTRTYGEIALQISGNRSSPRAVGNAVGRNPISILIPCHRVKPANGSLGGYASGAEQKAKLLELENISLYCNKTDCSL